MKIFSDVWNFLTALRFVDILFFFAVLILMILIITLIYFIMINNEDTDKVSDETDEMKIVKELKENMNNSEVAININEYEKEQEDKAIISYDELVNKGKKYEINYEKEDFYDDLSVKKVDLGNLANTNRENTTNTEIRLISFVKEEAFLEALKRLQKELG